MNRRVLGVLIVLISLLTAGDIMGQYFKNQGYWRKYRWQLTAGLGASNFLGELGGRDQIGTDFIWDLDTQVFKPAFSLGARYITSRRTAVRMSLSYATVSGDDALTTEKFRSNRNLNFRSRIYEAAGIFEFMFYEVRPGHRYNLAGVKGKKPKAANFYVFAGLGVTRFNPQGKVDDQWYDLQPLGTEGQNFNDGPEPYSLWTLVIPMGLGYRWLLVSPNVQLGLEIGHRMTFTDYMDDASTVYYDNASLGNQPDLSAQDNLLASYFGDPSLGYFIDDEGNQVPLNSTPTRAQRGDATDNDAYLFVQATLSYRLTQTPYRRRKAPKKRGKRIVF